MRSYGRSIQLFPLALLFVAVMLWTGWLAALLKIFNAPLILLLSLAITAVAWRFLRPEGGYYLETQDIRDRLALILVLVIVAAILITGFCLFHDSFGYRDESLYATNAIYLSQHGNLPYPVLDGADSRLFLNTVWNAELYGLLGMTGLRLTNVILVLLALICIYQLVKELTGSAWPAATALLLISLCYPFAWFMRRTVNEICFFSLCWICFYLIYRCLRPRSSFKLDLTLLMIIAPLPAFIRVEGLVVLGVCLLASVYVIFTRGLRAHSYSRVLFAVLIIVMVASAFGGYKHMAEKYGNNETISNADEGSGTRLTAGNELLKHQAAYSYWVMLKFGLLPAFLLIPPFFILLLMEKKKRAFAFFLLLAVLPFFYFFAKPSIYFDLPWFLRRFVAIVIPLALVSFSVVVFRLKRGQALAIAAAYLALTIFISSPVLFFGDRMGVNAYTARISQQIPGNARVLVDSYILGDYSLTGMLRYEFGRNVDNVTPWKRLTLKDAQGEEEIYLITNRDNFLSLYGAGKNVFDSNVTIGEVTIISETDERFPYIRPTSELHRGGFGDDWQSMDYRVALSMVKVPSEIINPPYKLMVVKLKIATDEKKEPNG
jgi:hypothetical protein